LILFILQPKLRER